MKFQATQQNLKNALNTVSRVAGSRASLPVLANVLMSTDNKRLKISATNLELGINYWIGGKVDDEGSITVPARLVGDFISNLPDGNVNLDVENNKLNIKTEHYKSTINGITSDEFPSIPEVSGDIKVDIPAKEFKTALSQTIIAASNDEARPVLTGIYIYTDGNDLVLVSTDSYRLAEKKITLDKKPEEFKAIVPARAMQELLRIIDSDDEDVQLHVDENEVMFTYRDVELVSRLIDGQFPDYKQLIPDSNEVKFTIDHDEFSNITKVASLFAKENAGSITLNVGDDKVSITSIASQVGENTSEAEAKVDGEGEVAINSRYILDALSVISSNKVEFGFSGKLNPCVLVPSEKEDSDYLHIIMPLRS